MKENSIKILLTRTDRIGDVLLSTPVIKNLKAHWPECHIAMMVRPYARDIVLGNPYLDEVIIYDKYGREKSLAMSILFAWRLRKKGFDIALMLHPTNRVHLIAFLAGIKRRIGFNRNLRFLLTQRIEHKKQQGKKHERDYTLEFLQTLGMGTLEKTLFMPIREASESYVEELLAKEGWQKGERLVAIHPAASCPSKIWPLRSFANVAAALAAEFKTKIVLVAGPEEVALAGGLLGIAGLPLINAAGKTSVSQLASLLRRCSLFISNDSGPVHIASALGVPVISIFGRNQPGLHPIRWGPTGKNDQILHKDIGCHPCLAHNCQKGFACLKAVSEAEVLSAARKILQTYSFDSR